MFHPGLVVTGTWKSLVCGYIGPPPALAKPKFTLPLVNPNVYPSPLQYCPGVLTFLPLSKYVVAKLGKLKVRFIF